MQNNRKPNELCSATKQVLLDLISATEENGNTACNEKLKEALAFANVNDFTVADAKFKSHKYPDKALTFYKKMNAISDDEHAINNAVLSSKATWLLDFMTDRMKQNNTCELSRESVLNYHVIGVNKFSDVVQELVDMGYILKDKGHSRGKATTYHINSDYAHYGDFSNRELFVIAENEEGQPITILDNSKGADRNVVTAFRKDENGKVIRVNKILSENA